MLPGAHLVTDLHIDIESFSRCDLKSGGMARYAEDESTDLLCVGYAFDDGPVNVWVPSAPDGFYADKVDGLIYVGPRVPRDLRAHIESGGKVVAFNANFERYVLNHTAGRRYDFPLIRIQQVRCVMAQARVAGLPGSLQDAGAALGVLNQKHMAGHAALRYLCKPRLNGTRATIDEEPERFIEVVNYNVIDVKSERDVDKATPRLSAAEQKIYEMDAEFNDRGVLIDLELVDNMEVLVDKYKAELEAKCRELTGIKPSQAAKLADWIRSHGFPELENLQADTVRKALTKELPDNVKTVLKIYSTYGMKAVAKYPAMRKAVCKDNRIRHMFMYYGAGTGRWSSTIVQLQNLARPSIDDPDTAIKISDQCDLDTYRMLWPGVDPMKIFATCVRGALIAAPGHELVFPDFSGVEARYNAWLWHEAWKIAAYRSYDQGSGPNLYCVVYGRCFGVDPASPEGVAGKQIGKVLDLSMGYEGGVGAFVKMAGTYRIDLKDMVANVMPTLPQDVIEEAVEAHAYAKEQGRTYELPDRIWVCGEALKRLWRRSHPRISEGWSILKNMAIAAVQNPGSVYKIPNGRILFKVEGQWLIMMLPSKRKLYYYRPEVRDNGKGETLYYYGINTVTRQWGKTATYGGALCNNETQGGCRDLLTRAKLRMRERLLPIIGSVHDEPLLEVEKGAVTDQEITDMMCGSQTWDEGLPLSVEIHRGKRYRK